MESGDGEGAGGCVLADLASLLNCTGCDQSVLAAAALAK